MVSPWRISAQMRPRVIEWDNDCGHESLLFRLLAELLRAEERDDDAGLPGQVDRAGLYTSGIHEHQDLFVGPVVPERVGRVRVPGGTEKHTLSFKGDKRIMVEITSPRPQKLTFTRKD